jgi:hypothetical protein
MNTDGCGYKWVLGVIKVMTGCTKPRALTDGRTFADLNHGRVVNLDAFREARLGVHNQASRVPNTNTRIDPCCRVKFRTKASQEKSAPCVQRAR